MIFEIKPFSLFAAIIANFGSENSGIANLGIQGLMVLSLF